MSVLSFLSIENKQSNFTKNGMVGKRMCRGQILVTQFEFEDSFGSSLEGDCPEMDVTPNLELLVTLVMNLTGVCNELYT